MPWLTLLIAKLALEDDAIALKIGGAAQRGSLMSFATNCGTCRPRDPMTRAQAYS